MSTHPTLAAIRVLLTNHIGRPAQIAKALGISRQRWQLICDRDSIDDATAARAAALLTIDPGYLLACIRLDAATRREGASLEEREAWLSVADRCRPASSTQETANEPQNTKNECNDNDNGIHIIRIKGLQKNDDARHMPAHVQTLHPKNNDYQALLIDIIKWLLCVPQIPPDSPRAAHYVRYWDVPTKIEQAKLNGTFDNLTSHCPPFDSRYFGPAAAALAFWQEGQHPKTTAAPPNTKQVATLPQKTAA